MHPDRKPIFVPLHKVRRKFWAVRAVRLRLSGSLPYSNAMTNLAATAAIPASLEDIAHIIQLALTPVFLLSGIATLLNVFGARLARVADQAEAMSGRVDAASGEERAHLSRRIAMLRRRSLILDTAVILASLGGVAVCGAVLTLFVGAVRDRATAAILFVLFGLGILCTLAALSVFCVEMLLASGAVRDRLRAQDVRAENLAEPPAARR